jgi:hypothetical protein
MHVVAPLHLLHTCAFMLISFLLNLQNFVVKIKEFVYNHDLVQVIQQIKNILKLSNCMFYERDVSLEVLRGRLAQKQTERFWKREGEFIRLLLS